MTKDEISKIKEYIEIHARRESRAIRITEIMRKAVDELERIAELEKENAELTSSNMDRYFQNLLQIFRLKRSKQQLTKAKEIITNLVKFDTSYKDDEEFQRKNELYDKILEEAEQFLKEGVDK